MIDNPNFRPGLSTPDHVVYEVDLGDTPPEDVLKYLESIRDKFPKAYIHQKKEIK